MDLASPSYLPSVADLLDADGPDMSDLDPTNQGGFRVLYAREVPLEMRLQTSDAAPAEAGSLEAVLCKVAVREAADGRPAVVKVELSSESDLFFHYTHLVDERAFAAMRDEQKLMIVRGAAGPAARSARRAARAAACRARATHPAAAPLLSRSQDFVSYPSVLAASLANAVKEPHTFLAVFIMNRDGMGRLDL